MINKKTLIKIMKIVFIFDAFLIVYIYFPYTTLSGYSLLLYALISIFYVLDSRISATIALLYLVSCPFFLYRKQDLIAEEMATKAYYFLVITVITQIRELKFKNQKTPIQKFYDELKIKWLIIKNEAKKEIINLENR